MKISPDHCSCIIQLVKLYSKTVGNKMIKYSKINYAIMFCWEISSFCNIARPVNESKFYSSAQIVLIHTHTRQKAKIWN